MKRFIILLLVMTLLLSGCKWLDGEYHSVNPHASQSNKQSEDTITITGYNDLKDALVDMVTAGRQQSTFILVNIEEERVDQYMNTAIMHVFENCAIGAYAAENINFEFGTSGGKSAISVEVDYIHSRQEILRIKSADDMEEVKKTVVSALNKCDASAVVLVKNYKEVDLIQYVKDYVENQPNRCMEMPQVSVSTYPEQGSERVVELSFTYQTSRDILRNMQNVVSPIFSAAELYVRDTEEPLQKYEQLYAFLMERFDYTLETSITPAYSLLRYGVGDTKAFATVYRVMCENAGLECQVVSGTHDGEAAYWNRILVEDVYYHVDLLESSKAGGFTLVLPENMEGYVWDYSLDE